jgi:hypothetical protein
MGADAMMPSDVVEGVDPDGSEEEHQPEGPAVEEGEEVFDEEERSDARFAQDAEDVQDGLSFTEHLEQPASDGRHRGARPVPIPIFSRNISDQPWLGKRCPATLMS